MRADVDDTLAVVLAGGAGLRVGGADKGLLLLFGCPLIEHVAGRLRPQCGRLLIVANRNIDEYADYAPTVHDADEGHAGPLAGLVAAFGFLMSNRHALPRWLLTASVDCPDPPRSLAARLQMALEENAATRCAFVRHAGKLQPLFAMYRIDDDPEVWRVSAHDALNEHGSAWRWQAAMEAIAVDFDVAGDAFHNLNTPEDFREYERA